MSDPDAPSSETSSGKGDGLLPAATSTLTGPLPAICPARTAAAIRLAPTVPAAAREERDQP